jgi:hypothetical protein
MILGRPTNLWLGFLTAATGFIGLVAAATGHPLDPAILGGAVGLEGAAILLIANGQQVVNPGDTVTVTTPRGTPNYETTIATPPAADPPPVPVVEPKP